MERRSGTDLIDLCKRFLKDSNINKEVVSVEVINIQQLYGFGGEIPRREADIKPNIIYLFDGVISSQMNLTTGVTYMRLNFNSSNIIYLLNYLGLNKNMLMPCFATVFFNWSDLYGSNTFSFNGYIYKFILK